MKGVIIPVLVASVLIGACRQRSSLDNVAADPAPRPAITQTIQPTTTQAADPLQIPDWVTRPLSGRDEYSGVIYAEESGGKTVIPARTYASMTSPRGPRIEVVTTPGPYAGGITLTYSNGLLQPVIVLCGVTPGYDSECSQAKSTADGALAPYRK